MTKLNGTEKKYLKFLASKAVKASRTKHTRILNSQIVVGQITVVDAVIIVFNRNNREFRLQMWIENLQFVDRLHIAVSEVHTSTGMVLSKLISEHDIPLKGLKKEDLSDGVVLTAVQSKTTKIDDSLENKEVYW